MSDVVYHHTPSGKVLRAVYGQMPDGDCGWEYELIDWDYKTIMVLSPAEYRALLIISKEGKY